MQLLDKKIFLSSLLSSHCLVTHDSPLTAAKLAEQLLDYATEKRTAIWIDLSGDLLPLPEKFKAKVIKVDTESLCGLDPLVKFRNLGDYLDRHIVEIFEIVSFLCKSLYPTLNNIEDAQSSLTKIVLNKTIQDVFFNNGNIDSLTKELQKQYSQEKFDGNIKYFNWFKGENLCDKAIEENTLTVFDLTDISNDKFGVNFWLLLFLFNLIDKNKKRLNVFINGYASAVLNSQEIQKIFQNFGKIKFIKESRTKLCFLNLKKDNEGICTIKKFNKKLRLKYFELQSSDEGIQIYQQISRDTLAEPKLIGQLKGSLIFKKEDEIAENNAAISNIFDYYGKSESLVEKELKENELENFESDDLRINEITSLDEDLQDKFLSLEPKEESKEALKQKEILPMEQQTNQSQPVQPELPPQKEEKMEQSSSHGDILSGWTGFILTVLVTSVLTFGLVRFLMPVPNMQGTPVLVVDLVQLSMDAAKTYKNEAEQDEALQLVFDHLKALQGSGYLLLNAQQVMAAPDAIVLKSADLLPKRESLKTYKPDDEKSGSKTGANDKP